VDTVQYAIEQCVFLHESHVKCVSASICWRKFQHKFPGVTMPNKIGIHKLINEV